MFSDWIRKSLYKAGVVLGMSLYMLNTTVGADEAQSYTSDVMIIDIQEELEDTAELFAAYVEDVWDTQLFDTSIDQYANLSSRYLSGNNLYTFQELKEHVSEIANGNRDSGVIEIIYDDWIYNWADYGLVGSQGNSDGYIGYEEDKLILNEIVLQDLHFDKIFHYLLMECPYELYWFDKANLGVSYDFSYDSTDQDYVRITSMKFRFGVTEEFRGEDEYSLDRRRSGLTKEALANADRILSNAETMNDLDKLYYYKDQICALTSYNSECLVQAQSYGNPWQLLYVFDNDPSTNVVCEGYAKAFQYLCDKTVFSENIKSILAAGTMNEEAHMWNIVRMPDEKNYIVDVTNSDEGMIGAAGQLFLTGAEGSIYDGYFVNIHNNEYRYLYDNTTRSYSGKLLRIASNSYEEKRCAHAHRTVVDQVEVSCMNDGYSGDKFCEDCGALLEEGKIVTALKEHDYADDEIIQEATCTANGKKYVKCIRCGDRHLQYIEQAEHQFSEWNIEQAPGNGTNGLKTRTCTVCHEIFSEIILATDKDGRPLQTYEVYTEEDLHAVVQDLYGHYTLMNDITLTEEWSKVGDSEQRFQGALDGNGHTIQGLRLKREEETALFGWIGQSGVVKNLTVKGSAKSSGAAIAVYNSGTVSNVNCYVDFDEQQDGIFLAGIVGCNYGRILDCNNYGAIINNKTMSDNYVGGIVAENVGRIMNCVNYGNIRLNLDKRAPSNMVGGICAICRGNGDVVNCINYGSITVNVIPKAGAYVCAGGIAGRQEGSSALGDICLVYNCKNFGDVITYGNQARVYSGGLIGAVDTKVIAAGGIVDENFSWDNLEWRPVGANNFLMNSTSYGNHYNDENEEEHCLSLVGTTTVSEEQGSVNIIGCNNESELASGTASDILDVPVEQERVLIRSCFSNSVLINPDTDEQIKVTFTTIETGCSESLGDFGNASVEWSERSLVEKREDDCYYFTGMKWHESLDNILNQCLYCMVMDESEIKIIQYLINHDDIHYIDIEEPSPDYCCRMERHREIRCEACSLILENPSYSSRIEHGETYVDDRIIEPTCVTAGVGRRTICKRCGSILVAEDMVDPLGHLYEHGFCIRCGKGPLEQMYGSHSYGGGWELQGVICDNQDIAIVDKGFIYGPDEDSFYDQTYGELLLETPGRVCTHFDGDDRTMIYKFEEDLPVRIRAYCTIQDEDGNLYTSYSYTERLME